MSRLANASSLASKRSAAAGLTWFIACSSSTKNIVCSTIPCPDGRKTAMCSRPCMAINAIAKIAMHGREHIAVLRPSGQGIVLHTMFFVEELHAMNQVKPAAAERFDAKELALAKRLIETLAAPFRPEQYHDTSGAFKSSLRKSRRDKRSHPPNSPGKRRSLTS